MTSVAVRFGNLKTHLNEENLGVAGGRNTGFGLATGEYILNIDDDTGISRDTMITLRQILEDNPGVGVVSPRIIHKQSKNQQNPHGDFRKEVGNYHGACHMVRKSALDATGYIDPLCSFGGEELDLSIRMRAHGYSVEYIPAVAAFHNNCIRSGGEGRRRRLLRAFNLPRIYFKYFPPFPATQISTRYFVSHAVSGLKKFGPGFLIPLFKSTVRGIKSGRKNQETVKNSIVKYYLDPNTEPDIGNVPLYKKMYKKFGKN